MASRKIKYVNVLMVIKNDVETPYCWSVHYTDGMVREYRKANDDSVGIWADELPLYIFKWLIKAKDTIRCMLADETHFMYKYFNMGVYHD